MNKGPFDWWTDNGFLEYQQDNVRIYDMDREKYLFVDQILYASTTERSWYIKNVMPHAQGRCLEIGLGLGVASKVILARPEVEFLLTLEKSEAVIRAYGKPLPRHLVQQANVYEWIENYEGFSFPSFDLIFVDHFTAMDDEELIEELAPLVEKLKKLLKPKAKLIVWIDESLGSEEMQGLRDLWVI